ncbi:MAG: hypothetical protein IT373_25410 [Polyangiaceae bacterium]|nr:hypothetical protein [Polyangiaceae bacterium]
MESKELSPGRLTAHWFEELPYSSPALRITAICGGKFMFRRRPKPDERADRCPICEERTR